MISLLSTYQHAPSVVVVIGVLLAAAFTYWYIAYDWGRGRVPIHFLDTWLVSLLVGGILARIAYVIMHWSDEYAKFIFWWSPYERYGDQVYLFRLMPWRLLRIVDGGFLVSAFVFGFLLYALISIVFRPIVAQNNENQIPNDTRLAEFAGMVASVLMALSLFSAYTIVGGTSSLSVIAFTAILFLILFMISSKLTPRDKSYHLYVLGLLSSIFVSIQIYLLSATTPEKVFAYLVGLILVLSLLLSMPVVNVNKRLQRRRL